MENKVIAMQLMLDLIKAKSNEITLDGSSSSKGLITPERLGEVYRTLLKAVNESEGMDREIP